MHLIGIREGERKRETEICGRYPRTPLQSAAAAARRTLVAGRSAARLLVLGFKGDWNGEEGIGTYGGGGF